MGGGYLGFPNNGFEVFLRNRGLHTLRSVELFVLLLLIDPKCDFFSSFALDTSVWSGWWVLAGGAAGFWIPSNNSLALFSNSCASSFRSSCFSSSLSSSFICLFISSFSCKNKLKSFSMITTARKKLKTDWQGPSCCCCVVSPVIWRYAQAQLAVLWCPFCCCLAFCFCMRQRFVPPMNNIYLKR